MKALEKRKELSKINDGENGASQSSNVVHIKRHLRRIIKKLILLKMFKTHNRRIKCLCELAHKYRKMLALGEALNIAASPAGMSIASEDPLKSTADVIVEPVLDIGEPLLEVDKVTIDNEIEKTSVETSLEASSSEFYEALCLKGLPQRFHMPAPKMLCRPSALRWAKPCCTRSCYETLEHVITTHYSMCQKSQPVSSQMCNCFK